MSIVKKAVRNLLTVILFFAMVIGNRFVRDRIEGVETSPGINAMRGMEKGDAKDAEKGNLLSRLTMALKIMGDFSYEEKNGTITITKYQGKDSEVHIPAEIMGKKVAVIGDGKNNVFEDADPPVTSVYFEDGIESLSLEKYSFRSSFSENSIASVHFPEKMERLSIKGGVFSGMPLEEITLPSGELEIGESAFEECSLLKSVNFGAGDGPITIGGRAFFNTPIRELTLPEGETEIGEHAFHFAKLRNVAIPKCNGIGQLAFYGCASLESVTLGEGEKESVIGEQAFGGTSIRELTIPGNITELGKNLFSDSEILEKVVWMPVSFEGVSQYMSIETFSVRRKLDLYLSESVVVEGGGEGTWMMDSAKENLTIHAPADSAIIGYAKENGIPCVEENWYESQ